MGDGRQFFSGLFLVTAFSLVMWMVWGAPVQAAPVNVTTAGVCSNGETVASLNWDESGATPLYYKVSRRAMHTGDPWEFLATVPGQYFRDLDLPQYSPAWMQYKIESQDSSVELVGWKETEGSSDVATCQSSYSLGVYPAEWDESQEPWGVMTVKIRNEPRVHVANPAESPVPVVEQSPQVSLPGDGWDDRDREHAQKASLLNTLGSGLVVFGIGGLLVFNVGKRGV